MSEPRNQAAWLESLRSRPLVVRSAPMLHPDAHEVVIRARAVAINPVDWTIQETGIFAEQYPYISGHDVAGEVHSVGSRVTAFKPGDRVIAHLDHMTSAKLENAGFQLFPKTSETFVAKLPDALSYTQGTVLPLAISTSAAGLYEKDKLALPLPRKGAPATGQVLLVWGGSSSVGSTAIQLAVASGLEVATTASAHNHDYVRSLGATYVFDHAKDTVPDDIVRALKGKPFAGVFDAISVDDSVRKSTEIASRLDGNKFVATVLPVKDSLIPSDVKTALAIAPRIDTAEIAPAIWGKFVPGALADGSLQAKPEPLVVGKGLHKIQEACDRAKAGMSARKVVVELD